MQHGGDFAGNGGVACPWSGIGLLRVTARDTVAVDPGEIVF